MKFIKGSPCFCDSGNKIEDCCIDFEAKISCTQQVRLRQKYRYLKDSDNIMLLAEKKKDGFYLTEYSLLEEDNIIMNRCSEILSEKSQIQTFHELFENEYNSLIKYKNDVEFNLVNGESNEINRLVVNFVSNSKLFIDYLESTVKKRYQENYEEWKKFQSSLFDETLEYGLLYHLRNHVQHVGLPIQSVNAKLILLNGEEKIKAEFFLSKKTLLKDRSLHKKVKRNLHNIDDISDNLSFIPLAEKYAGMVEALYILALRLYIEHHETELKQIEQYFDSRDLIGQLFEAKIQKKNYLQGSMEGMNLKPLMSKASIINSMLELSKIGAVNLTIVD